MKQLKLLTKQEEISFVVVFFYVFESSNDFFILISFIFSFITNKANLIPTVRAPLLLIFLSDLFIAFELIFSEYFEKKCGFSSSLSYVPSLLKCHYGLVIFSK